MAANVVEQVKEHKKILLPAAGVLVVALIIVYIMGSGLSILNPVPVDDIVSSNKTYSSAPSMALQEGKDYSAVVKTSLGDITVDLYEDQTPATVNNFVFLSNENFYDGVTFHRVIGNFMIQAGDPRGDGTGGPGYNFDDEIVSPLTFKPFTLAMANSGPDTNGSQFFITTRNSSTGYLDGDYTIFGQVTAGFDVVDKIESVETDDTDKPLAPVVINDVEIVVK